MGKQDTNKKYDEFWNNKEFDIKSSNGEDIDSEIVNNEDNEDKKIKRKTTMSRKKAEKVIKEDVVVITHKFDIQSPVSSAPNNNRTLKQIYEQYITDGKPYKIYLRGQVIFDSASHKVNPIFHDDYFILFGNKYIYKGIRFEKY